MSELDFDKDVNINPTELDVEWLRQAGLYKKYSDEAAYARDKKDRAKEALEVAQAILASDIRKNFTKYGLEKVTESSVWETVNQFKGKPGDGWTEAACAFHDANEACMKAKLECDLIQGALSSVEQRKYALENMVRLLNQNYFSSPTTPRDIGDKWKEHLANRVETQQSDATEKFQERRRRRSVE